MSEYESFSLRVVLVETPAGEHSWTGLTASSRRKRGEGANERSLRHPQATSLPFARIHVNKELHEPLIFSFRVLGIEWINTMEYPLDGRKICVLI
jgi:hypothetical protein